MGVQEYGSMDAIAHTPKLPYTHTGLWIQPLKALK